MRALISRSKIEGRVNAPSSKSYTIRGLMCGALAKGRTQIVAPLGSDDTSAAARVLMQIGIGIRQARNMWTINGGEFQMPEDELYCGDSAATLRFLTALCSIIKGTCRLTAGKSLSHRPVSPLLEALRKLGVRCSATGDLPPLIVEGGVLPGGITSLPGDISSQFVSALLMVAPFAQQTVTVRLTTPLESRPYVMMTMDTMQWFGITVAFNDALDEFEVMPQKYEPARYMIEGDWSSASYFLALGALAGKVEVSNLPAETTQGDRLLLTFLREMGAGVQEGKNTVSISQARLKPLQADLTDCIDLLPTLAVLAAVAEGTSVFTGINRARFKESDRVVAVREGLARLGIRTQEEANRLTITGGKITGTLIDSKNDHRIAMAFSLLGVVAGEVEIDHAECVTKTYPEFWEVLRSTGAEVKVDGE